jgi:hypothetical protein
MKNHSNLLSILGMCLFLALGCSVPDAPHVNSPEPSTIASLPTIGVAQATYASTNAESNYAASFDKIKKHLLGALLNSFSIL